MKKLIFLKLTLISSLSLVAFSSIAITSTSCGKRKVDPHMDLHMIVHANENVNSPDLWY